MGSATSRNGTRLALGVLLLGGLALRVWGLDYGLPHPMARPDEEALVPRLVGFDAGDPNPHWFMYPTLSLYLTYAWVRAGFVAAAAVGAWTGPTALAALAAEEPAALYLAARLLSAVLGTAAIGAAYVLGRQLAGRRAGLVAAALVATSFLHVRESHFFKPDAALSLFLTLALAACGRLAERGTRAAAILAGAACGLALAVKYALLLAVPLAVAALLGPTGAGLPSRPARLALAALAAGATGFAGSPYTLLAWDEFRGWIRVARMWVAYGGEGGGTGFRYHLAHSFLDAQGAPLTVFALGALAALLPVRRILPVAAFVLTSLVQLGLASAAYTRYVTPLLPALYAVAGAGLVRLADRLPATRLRPVAVLAGLALLVARPLASAVRFDQIAAAPDTRVLASEWVRDHVPRSYAILLLGAPWPYTFGDPLLPGYTVRRTATLDPAAGIRYVVTHEHPLPFSRPPAALDALRPRLALVRTFSPFVGDEVPPEAVFELRDAFYVPVAGFGRVVRGGPIIRVYRVRDAEEAPRGDS